ncbi:MAG: phosphotransferase [Halanaerobiales bacterium]|nr:phosphotransferase [Halanaerobiales bacterium]
MEILMNDGLKNSIVNIDEYHILKKFKSKKNQVFLVTGIEGETRKEVFVLKKFRNNIEKEAYWLNLLKEQGILVPEIFAQGEDYLILEYLQGETLCDCFTRQEDLGNSIDQLVLDRFFCWLKEFYQTVRVEQNWILGDVNLRNFILDEKNMIYGIDFEECSLGEIEEDAGKICAFALTYTPAFTLWKSELTRVLMGGLVRELALDFDLVKNEFSKELEAINLRRELDIPQRIISRF